MTKSTLQNHTEYDPCEDTALREELSLEQENDSENFEDYELSEDEVSRVYEKAKAIFLKT